MYSNIVYIAIIAIYNYVSVKSKRITENFRASDRQ